MRSPAALTTAFREQGLKVTPQRQLLFRLLHDNDRHPTAEAVFATASAQMPGISLRTVYQTLSELAAMGELRIIHFTGGSSRFDPNMGDHHHAECTSCGDLRDVYVAPAPDLFAHGLDGFRTHRTDIVFRGLCAACAETVPSSTQPTSH